MVDTKSDSQYDAIVIGGGPGGSTASTLLAQKGYNVLLLEKEKFPRFHIGESLTYINIEILEELNVLQKMESANWIKRFGISFVDTLGFFKTFYFAEVNNKYVEDCFAYHVDRAKWDKMLLDNCREHNVIVKEQHEVIDLLYEGEKVGGVKYHTDQGQIKNAKAKIVIDASGRNTFLANKFGIKVPNHRCKRLAVFTRFNGAKLPDDIDAGNLMIFKLNHKDWAWLTPLPEDVQSVGVMINGDNLRADSSSLKAFFLEAINQNSDLVEKLKNAKMIEKIRIDDDYPYSIKYKVGTGYVLIGDAAGCVDPIFSSGIAFAMYSAKYVAEDFDFAMKANNDSPASFGRYIEKMNNAFDACNKLIRLWHTLSYRNFFYTVCQPEHRSHFAGLFAGHVFESRSDFIIERMERFLNIPGVPHERRML